MSRRAATGTSRRGGPSDRRRHDDGGQSLVEISLALFVFTLVIAAVLLTTTTFDNLTTSSVNASQGTNEATVLTQDVDAYLSGAITPLGAAFNAGNPSGTQQLSLTSPCWGAGQPAGGKGQTLPPSTPTTATPARSAVSVAHDFDVVFCAYKPSTTTPHVYEMSLTSCSGTYGNCTLNITDYGTSCIPGVASPGASGLGASGCTNPGNVVGTFGHIWCDAYCQGTTGAGTNGASQSVPRACYDVPGDTVAGCTAHTPPLFEYFSETSGGQYGSTTTNDGQSLNFTVENTGGGTCTSSGGLFMDLAGTSGSCVGSVSKLAQINLVVFNVTLLGNDGLPLNITSGPTTKGTLTKSPKGEINQQIFLPGLSNVAFPCGSPIIEVPFAPSSLVALDDAGSPLSDIAQNLNAPTVTGTPTGFNRTPGPLACNVNYGGLGLDGSTAFADSTYFNAAASTGNLGQLFTLEAWVKPAASSSSLMRVLSDGDSSASSGGGFELYEQANGAGFTLAAGGSTASTSASLALNTWYFVAATVTNIGATPGLTMYVCGATLGTGSTPGCATPGTHSGAVAVSYPASAGCDLLIGAQPTNTSGAVACASPEPTVGSTTCPASDYPSSIPASCPLNFFNGQIADVAIYPKVTSNSSGVLSANQITTEYLEMAQ